MVSDLNDWVNGGVVEQRPGIPGLPATKSLAVDEDWAVAGVPDGTEVFLDGVSAGTVDATGLTLAFPVAGLWQVRLEPPFPWAMRECVVTVT